MQTYSAEYSLYVLEKELDKGYQSCSIQGSKVV